MTFMRPPPSGPERATAGTRADVLRQTCEGLSFLVSTSTPGWDREARYPPESGEWLACVAELLAQARYTLAHAEVRAAVVAALQAYEAWEIEQSQTDVRQVARPPPR